MRDLSECPTRRPFWCAHPQCLWCDWDDDAYHWASEYAAHPGERPEGERYRDPAFPEADYIWHRRYVAWLCEDCAEAATTVRWFVRTVQRRFPEAQVLLHPGRNDERAIHGSD